MPNTIEELKLACYGLVEVANTYGIKLPPVPFHANYDDYLAYCKEYVPRVMEIQKAIITNMAEASGDSPDTKEWVRK